MEIMMKLSYKLLIALALLTATNAQASLMKTQDTLAVCSNGEQATFVVSESKSNNWFVYFEGGGLAISPESYKKRKSSQKNQPRTKITDCITQS
tara:strand:- start:278 stop:559 length:282 start_codon:yes stop_codon:yes gene_type:complete